MNQDIHSNETRASQGPQKERAEIPPKKRRKETGLWWLDDKPSAVGGERALWVAVVTQAMMDALSKSKNPEALYLKHEAIRWLSDDGKSFREVCMLADMDPDYVRKKAKKALLSPKAWRAEPGKGKRYQERKAKRAKQQHSPHQPQSDVEAKESVNADVSNIIVGPWIGATSSK